MMKRFFLAALAVISLFSCGKDEKIPDNPTANDVNVWVEKTLRQDYLYYTDMPEKSSLDFSKDPSAFFSALLSSKDGKDLDGSHYYYSTLKKKTATKSIDADNSYGYEFAIYKINSSTTDIAALVLYVLPNSPAAEAGLQRGDWVMTAGGTQITTSNYSTLLKSGSATTLGLYKYSTSEKTLVKDRIIPIAASRIVEDTPFLCDTIYQIGGKKIAYLFYNHFMTGPDNADETYNTRLKQIFTNYKSEGVTDFVLDMRYNGGGRVKSSQLMASLLAPSSAFGNTFCYLVYNDKNQKNNSTEKFESASSVKSANLQLTHYYFIVTSSTASSSELVINSLIPYLGRSNMTLIGTQTFGKVVGASVYDYSDTYGYILSPIAFYIYNAEHKADYADGFTPDIIRNELVLSSHGFYPLGDTRDYLLDAALSAITGQASLYGRSTLRKASSSMKLLGTSLDNEEREATIEK